MDFVKNKIVKNSDVAVKDKVVDRAIKVYLFTQEKLAQVRYTSSVDGLYEMVRAITNTEMV